MNKQEKKLLELGEKANACTTREEALKILNKEKKTRAKLYVKRMIENE